MQLKSYDERENSEVFGKLRWSEMFNDNHSTQQHIQISRIFALPQKKEHERSIRQVLANGIKCFSEIN